MEPAVPPRYRRLPGRSRGLASSGTLWWTDDHLLVAEVRFWTESYRRIYFRDIQAVVIAEDGRFFVANLLWFTLLVFLGLVVASTHGGWRVFWAFPAALALAAGAMHFARGATCSWEMTTPLAAVRLPLRRVRQARRAMQRLRPLIEAAQGGAPREAIVAQAAEHAGAPAPAPSAPIAGPAVPPPILRAGRIRAHVVLCACLGFDAMVTAYQLPGGNTILDTVGAVVALACTLAAIWALVAQHGTDLGRPFAWFGASALAVQIVLFFFGVIFIFVGAMRNATTPTLQPDLAGRALASGAAAAIGPWEIVIQSILTLWGLVLLLRWRRARGSAWISLTT